MSVPSDQRALFLRLPDELIHEIFKLCHVSDHFNLALTCRRLADGGNATLERHRAAYREYGVVTDWKYLTIPSVLQKVITDPYVAWNVRTIEIFGTRYSWEQWGDFMSEVPSTVRVFPSPDPEDILSLTFGDGNDGILKALLITLCPRLNVLKTAKSNDETGNNCDWELMEWLSQIITMSWRRDSWAPGLKSLREVSIGIPTRLCLMLLPGLKSVYFGNMNLQTVADWGSEEQPPPLAALTGCSTVEHVFLDQFVDRYDTDDQQYTAESVMEFLLIPKKLKTLTVRGGLKLQLSNPANNQALYVLMLHLSKSLEHAIEYNCRLRPSESTWGWFGRTQPIRRLYSETNKVTINAVNVMTLGFPQLATRKEEIDEWKGTRYLYHRAHQILPNVEVILVQKSYRDDEKMDSEVMEKLERLLYLLVENTARSDGKLKAIFIQQQSNPNKGNTIADFDYSKLINLGRERDIDIHVKENKNVPFYQYDFPTPPIMSSLQETGTENVISANPTATTLQIVCLGQECASTTVNNTVVIGPWADKTVAKGAASTGTFHWMVSVSSFGVSSIECLVSSGTAKACTTAAFADGEGLTDTATGLEEITEAFELSFSSVPVVITKGQDLLRSSQATATVTKEPTSVETTGSESTAKDGPTATGSSADAASPQETNGASSSAIRIIGAMMIAAISSAIVQV
ncbi:hypothetical protein HYE67_010057 [Fusarium culmorum]|uniref:F-box domain-containing protein n=1 Tax=Fusarium culmorum TaxID=5516 RepID=A0A7S8HZV6_FUSCU|nr:hypothetical protein HYE67_010057 [Fusarium culmorum]